MLLVMADGSFQEKYLITIRTGRSLSVTGLPCA